MNLLVLGGLGLVFFFGVVIFFGAPYLPTLKKQIEPALDLLDLMPGDTILELGCGDGRILRAAAQRGLKAVGYELNPILALYAAARNWRYRKNIRVIWGNYWKAQWPPAQGIFVFLLNPYMSKLNTKITKECKKPVRLVSFAFLVPDKKIVKQKAGLYLYTYS